ncbi:MAG: chemotaxis protein CheV [Pseudomonadales bacterium]|nr:chemotaxis protein CheV [Pseudomonadales bacterium]
MAGILETVNQRTQLVGQNRLELLLFSLKGKQLYGINVFKVREVLNCPHLYTLPNSHSYIRGVAHIRGAAISIIDLQASIGMGRVENPSECLIIITEYNTKVQGFLVNGVDRIVNKNWESVLPPPEGAGTASYLTAVTDMDGEIVEILDVEKILSEVSPVDDQMSEEFVEENKFDPVQHVVKKVLIVDDSAVARKQIQRTVEKLGLECVLKKDGKEALDHVRELMDSGVDILKEYYMVISDVEMPEMDGYTFTAEMKSDPRSQNLFILMHTSLSGVFNMSMVQKVGADDFLAKFKAEELAKRVSALLS